MSGWLTRHSGAVILAMLLATGMLVIPMLWLASDELASTEPGGAVFDLRDEIEEKLDSPFYTTAYIAEALDGDMLTQAALWNLHERTQALRDADATGELAPEGMGDRPLLARAFDRNAGVEYVGVSTIADAVQQMLTFHPVLRTNLEAATDDQVKFAVAQLLLSPLTASVGDQLSAQAISERRVVLGQEIDYWRSPAVVFVVLADNASFGGGSGGGLATDEAGLNRERFARNVQAVLRANAEEYQLWGLAIDQTLEAQEQGITAGVFIMFTVVAALAIVGVSLRSYWAAALTAGGIAALMIWLKGISALVGIKGGLIVDLIVPIAMVSLGVDFAVHAIRRYQEERRSGYPPERAVAVGLAGVLGALFLAMLSDGIAFLSNVPSGIEAVVHFGSAAGIAVASAFVVLGVVLPLSLMRVDRLLAVRTSIARRFGAVPAIAGATGVTIATGAGVILLVALDAGVGVLVLAATSAVFVGGPLLVLLRAKAGQADATPAVRGQDGYDGKGSSRMENAVAAFVLGLARRKELVIPAAALITIASAVLAFRLEATFDVKDFFAPESDIVIGLDKLDQHIADRGGESGTIYVRGDLTQPGALQAIDRLLVRLADNPYVASNPDGTANVFRRNVLVMTRMVMDSPYAREQVLAESGVALSDAGGDRLPDTPEQMNALLRYITANGVPRDERTLLYAPEEVRSALYFDPADPRENIAIFLVGIPGTREQSIIPLARQELLEDIRPLEQHPAIDRVGLTGPPFVRDAELTAAVDSLRTSLPLAAAGAFALLLVALRSLRYAMVTVIPIGLVVAWLYAVMELAGFSLNFVTATIGAVSIGVGIDYSIHMTARFREEMGRSGSRLEALEKASRGTGIALMASAGSSVTGFAIMGFAPMPLFSTYGILTAVMIFLALAASLVVLPSLLMAVTRDPVAAATPVEAAPHG